MAHDPLAWIDAELQSLAAQQMRRALATRDGPQGVRLAYGAERLLNFGSNDYLSLAADPRLAAVAAAIAAADGWGSGASPLVVGHTREHRRLEERLARFEGAEAALVFGSGYAANIGAVASLAGPGDAIFSDALNHASLVDGCRLSRAAVAVYAHADIGALAGLLAAAGGYRRRLIVTDSLFSMDGDLAPLADLAELAERHDAMLLVDEAHATGVFGPHGRGIVEQLGLEDAVHARVGTLSKALGSVGGFVCGSQRLVDWLVNRARTYIFSTAAPAAVCAAAVAALDIVEHEPERRLGVLAQAESLRGALLAQGWNIGQSASQIVPVIVNQPGQAVALSAALRAQSILAPAIRPPSVPADSSRLRISLTYAHGPAEIAALADALKALRGRLP